MERISKCLMTMACVMVMSACGELRPDSQSPSLSSDTVANTADEVAYCQANGHCASESIFCCGRTALFDRAYCLTHFHTPNAFHCCSWTGSCTNSNQCCAKGPGRGCINHRCR
jgi:hypothetical protein